MNKTFKKNKGFIIALFAIFFNATLAQAQPGGQQGGQQGPPPVPTTKQIKKMVRDVSKELSLSGPQEKKVSEIYFAHFEEVKGKMESSNKPDRKEMEKLESIFEKEAKAELTKDQQKQYDAYLKKQQAQRGKR